MQTEFVVVFVTVESRADGERIARSLVESRLAACVNVIGPIRSVYTWEGEVTVDDEHLLMIKSRGEAFAALEAHVRSVHGYEVPEVIAVPLVAGSDPYLEWLRQGTVAPRSVS
jgi:uncharacterized protein involved in tolerance to divalent cations